jgi:hypothetical protein
MLCALLVVALGCGATQSDTVRTQAAQNFACPATEVQVAKLRATDSATTIYQVDGCGRSAVYTCTESVERYGVGGKNGATPEVITRCRAGGA